MKNKKLLEKVVRNPYDVSFSEMSKLLEGFGFNLKRIKGSHHIYKHPDVPYLINIQNKGGKVKSYQVNQFIDIINEFKLSLKK
ncbi:MAG: type II toxin-antitoxin system HicA family toxin [Ignavibacteria bacterium]|nr:type II toxin-antitoxin system HicA family toxin [Ignavibacteria bacterium]